jgi:hypothetical protein
MPGALRAKVQQFWVHCNSSSAESTAEVYTTGFLDVPSENNQGDSQVW